MHCVDRTFLFIYRDPVMSNDDKPFHLEVRKYFCGAHLLLMRVQTKYILKRHHRISFFAGFTPAFFLPFKQLILMLLESNLISSIII